jgi:membrane-bound ClpP family serine protease
MQSTIILVIIAIFTALIGTLVTALSRHKKACARDVRLIGKTATVETPLLPEGTVIIGGELWPARSVDHSLISSQARVRIIGFESFMVLVEICD